MTVTVTPAVCVGRGTTPALQVVGASDDPKIVNNMPGAKAVRYDAAFPSPVIVVVPDVTTVTFIEALAVL